MRGHIDYDVTQPFVPGQPTHMKDPPQQVQKIPNQVRCNGIVKKFMPEKGFGFITKQLDKLDVFFHQSDAPRGWVPQSGQRVSFSILQTDRGPRAVYIRVL